MKIIIENIFSYLLQLFKNPRKLLAYFTIVFLIALSTFLLSMKMVGDSYNYKIGDIATDNIRVPRDIVYQLKKETELARKSAEKNVPLVFDMEKNVLYDKIRNINFLFNHISNINIPSNSELAEYEKVERLTNRLPEYLQYNDRILAALIRYSSTDSLRKTIVSILNDVYSDGILESEYKNPLNIENKDVIFRVQSDLDTKKEIRKEFENIRTVNELRRVLNPLCAKYTRKYPKDQQWAIYIIVRSLISPNIVFNPEETKIRINESARTVKPVRGVLKKGKIIVRDGNAVTSDEIEQLEVLNRYTSELHFNYIIGILLFQIVFFAIVVLFLSSYLNDFIPDINSIIITGSLLALYFLFSYIVYKSFDFESTNIIFPLILPIPFLTMTIAVIYNKPLSILSAIYAIFFANMLNMGDYTSLIVGLSLAFISIFGVKTLEKRTDFLKLGFVLGFAGALLVIAVGLVEEFTRTEIIKNVQLSFMSGLSNTIAVMGFFPLIEYIFNLTTKFKLLELTDLNAPIFKEMLIKAPGTYNHSLMVANMAEAACKEINANHLLARVGGYYHDIGKIPDSHIYIENKMNQTVDLSPSEYSSRIISHVNKGVEMARKENLPSDVISFIKEHHGDTVMTFFYHKALEEVHENDDVTAEVNAEDFRYPGPKPHSKETAIVMLADAIEAASRSVTDPSFTKLETMVKKVIYNKLNDGELDYSNLTMQELNKIQKAFLIILNGIFHNRIQYPEKDEIRKLERELKEDSKNK